MTELTTEDIPTLRRLAEFWLDRTKGNWARQVLCKANSGLCLHMIAVIERNGKLRPQDSFDATGRIRSATRSRT